MYVAVIISILLKLTALTNYIVINIEIDQYKNQYCDNIFCHIAQPHFKSTFTKKTSS